MLILELKKIFKDQVHIFQDTYFKRSRMFQITIMYYFKYTNHDILLNCLVQNFYKLFLRARNLHQ